MLPSFLVNLWPNRYSLRVFPKSIFTPSLILRANGNASGINMEPANPVKISFSFGVSAQLVRASFFNSPFTSIFFVYFGSRGGQLKDGQMLRHSAGFLRNPKPKQLYVESNAGKGCTFSFPCPSVVRNPELLVLKRGPPRPGRPRRPCAVADAPFGSVKDA